MNKLADLPQEHQDALKKKYPDFESNDASWQDNAINMFKRQQQKNEAKRAAKARANKAALKESGAQETIGGGASLSDNPTGFHKSLYKGMEAIENAANDHPDQRAMQPVFNHLENARASLREHWNQHHEGKVEEAAGHLQNAADAIGNAARAFHVLSPLPGGAEPIAKHVKDVADGYKFNVANGRARNVKHASYDTQLGDMADTGLAQQVKKEAKAGKAWDAYVKNADKKLPPTVTRETQEERTANQAKRLDVSRAAREAEPKDTRTFADLSPEEKAQRIKAAAGRVKSRATTAPTPEYITGAQKYTGTLGQFGKNSRVGVAPENAQEYLDHAITARKALLQGKPIPSETKVALGAAGIEAVHRAHNEAVFGTSSSTVEPGGEDVPRTRGGRGGSLEEFATGRA